MNIKKYDSLYTKKYTKNKLFLITPLNKKNTFKVIPFTKKIA